MKTDQKQSLTTLLLGVLAGSLLTALAGAIASSATRRDHTWDHAWANSSSPVDLHLAGSKQAGETEAGPISVKQWVDAED